MRKMLLVVMLFVLMLGSINVVSAQDEETEASGLPQCTPEELAAVQEALITEFQTFAGMGMLEATGSRRLTWKTGWICKFGGSANL